MASPNGIWLDARTLDIIRRVIQHHEISDTERRDMYEVLNIHPSTFVATNFSSSHVAESPPPSYAEALRQGHSSLLPLLPLRDRGPDSSSSIMGISTDGTNQTDSSGYSNPEQPSSPSGSAHRRQHSITGSEQASPSASALRERLSTTLTDPSQVGSSAAIHRGLQADPSVGRGQPDVDGDIHDLLVPDPRRAGDRSAGGQRGAFERRDG